MIARHAHVPVAELLSRRAVSSPPPLAAHDRGTMSGQGRCAAPTLDGHVSGDDAFLVPPTDTSALGPFASAETGALHNGRSYHLLGTIVAIFRTHRGGLAAPPCLRP